MKVIPTQNPPVKPVVDMYRVLAAICPWQASQYIDDNGTIHDLEDYAFYVLKFLENTGNSDPECWKYELKMTIYELQGPKWWMLVDFVIMAQNQLEIEKDYQNLNRLNSWYEKCLEKFNCKPTAAIRDLALYLQSVLGTPIRRRVDEEISAFLKTDRPGVTRPLSVKWSTGKELKAEYWLVKSYMSRYAYWSSNNIFLFTTNEQGGAGRLKFFEPGDFDYFEYDENTRSLRDLIDSMITKFVEEFHSSRIKNPALYAQGIEDGLEIQVDSEPYISLRYQAPGLRVLDRVVD